MNLYVIHEYLKKNFFNHTAFFVLMFANVFTNASIYATELQNVVPDNLTSEGRSVHCFAGVTSTNTGDIDGCFAAPSILNHSIKADNNRRLSVVFDELDGNSRSLYVTFLHCDARWNASDLMEVEYIDGFNKIYDLETPRFSFNTTVDYVHYDLIVPTDMLKLSGNYIVRIYDATSDELLLSFAFMICEDIVGIDSRIVRHEGIAPMMTRRRQTDLSTQNLSVSVKHAQLDINNYSEELKVVCWQNQRFDTRRYIETPTFIRSDEAIYEGGEILAFEAGNEYRWLDTRNLKYTPSNVVSIDFHDPYYHFTLYPDRMPKGYSFYEDFNGGQYIEARYIHDDPAIAADYQIVHFTLPSPTNDADVYVFGELTGYTLSERNKMTYQPELKAYTATLWVKQGLHNYKYLACPHEIPGYVTSSFYENSFAETENDYYIAVYYRSYSDTYDRLVGFKKHNSLTSPNVFIR